MPALPQSNIHLDILMGRDEALECADFMMPGMYIHCSLSHSCCLPISPAYPFVLAASELAQPLDIHADMEKKLRM